MFANADSKEGCLSPVGPVASWNEPCANKKQKKERLNSGGKRKHRKKRKGSPKPQKKAKASESGTGLGECVISIKESFGELSDPRVNRRRRHLLIDIMVIAICAVICGAESWKDMQLWANAQQSWLERILELPNGIPSRDTLRRVISRLNPEEFQACFLRWMKGLSRATDGQLVALDGKTIRRSMDSASDQKPLHVVSAWAAEQHFCLGQIAVDAKSNEITAIPQLLKLLELKGALITIDAMGCQKEIARAIIKQKADYCLAVKGNQEHLYQDIVAHFETCLETDFANVEHDEHFTEETAHGRFERRFYYTTGIPRTLRNRDAWAKLKSIGLVITYRAADEDEDPDGELRYYINSFPSDAKKLAWATRGHWGIENSLHWIMDVTFNEDQCRVRKDHGAENISWLRRFAISLLKNENTINDTVRAKQRRAMWNIQYLERVLLATIPQN
jgi:predicted transposase YbfD/YdcC